MLLLAGALFLSGCGAAARSVVLAPLPYCEVAIALAAPGVYVVNDCAVRQLMAARKALGISPGVVEEPETEPTPAPREERRKKPGREVEKPQAPGGERLLAERRARAETRRARRRRK